MGRPIKEGLRYYCWDVNAIDVDLKLYDLKEEYGPLGMEVYRNLLDIIYSNSYYIQINKDKLAKMIVERIGNKWITRSKCLEVLGHLAGSDLVSGDLVHKDDVWTSIGIQKRYLKAIEILRRGATLEKYNLLEKDSLNAPSSGITSEETRVNSEETRVFHEETMHIKEKKENICAFDIFWEEYPRKVNKKKARALFESAIKKGIKFDDIMNGLKNHKNTPQWLAMDGKFIPHPTTWLNGERWNDEFKMKKNTYGEGFVDLSYG